MRLDMGPPPRCVLTHVCKLLPSKGFTQSSCLLMIFLPNCEPFDIAPGLEVCLQDLPLLGRAHREHRALSNGRGCRFGLLGLKLRELLGDLLPICSACSKLSDNLGHL